MPTAEKEATVAQVFELMTRARGIFLTDFSGVNVGAMTDLRSRLREISSTYLVAKNRLTAIAADRAGLPELREFLTGPTGIVFAEEDPTQSIKVLTDLAKLNIPVKIKGGVLDKEVYTKEQVERLATLPSREVLLAQVVFAIQGPITGLAVCLQGILQKFVGTLHALSEKRKEEEGAA